MGEQIHLIEEKENVHIFSRFHDQWFQCPTRERLASISSPLCEDIHQIVMLFFDKSIFPQVRPYRGGSDKCYTGFKNRQICVSGKPEKHAQPYLQVYHIFSQLLKLLLIDADLRLIPGLRGSKPLGMWAGLRPATEHADYQISFRLEKQNIYFDRKILSNLIAMD